MKTIAAVALGLVFAGGCKDGGNTAVQPTAQPSTTTISRTTAQPSVPTTSDGDEPSAPKSAGEQPTPASQISRDDLEDIVLDLTSHVNKFCDGMVQHSGGARTPPSLIIEAARRKLFDSDNDGGFRELVATFTSKNMLTDEIVRGTTRVLKYTPGLLEAKKELANRKAVELAKEGAENGAN